MLVSEGRSCLRQRSSLLGFLFFLVELVECFFPGAMKQLVLTLEVFIFTPSIALWGFEGTLILKKPSLDNSVAVIHLIHLCKFQWAFIL